ncbi:DUF2515 family protein [Cohnella sp. WQ 127256]|uniref:DUF2515 family protein n=1 Tax=Cohnella sp. WQ 127256 TaxID=2938790 RepID=UPI0021198D22|nr:DUF2515 family protein [Cohnella sp. WQ 127256]
MKNTLNSRKGLSTLLQMPGQFITSWVGKINSLQISYRLTRSSTPLIIHPERVKHFTSLFHSAKKHSNCSPMTQIDEQICSKINEMTVQFNRNNITRTAAYWEVYRFYPELQWAFLAHMVSRNGGWSMTDLRGEWLPQLMDNELITSTFEMLEACNSLIFGDAYPQLCLYVESQRTKRNLFHLLPHFGVSSFMIPFWNQFWSDGNAVPLTEALIINEQHFIQSRVVEDTHFRRNVFDSLSFRSLPLLQLNQIVFPIGEVKSTREGNSQRLVGRVLENFTDLQERIEFGKSLYGMLFGYPQVLKETTLFAESIIHTGSRADYWPQRFRKLRKEKTDGKPDKGDSSAGQSFSSMWLSPSLSEAWPDQPYKSTKEKDWFHNIEVMSYLRSIRLPRVIDMTHEHLLSQNKLQTAVLLERSFMKGASSRRTGRG